MLATDSHDHRTSDDHTGALVIGRAAGTSMSVTTTALRRTSCMARFAPSPSQVARRWHPQHGAELSTRERRCRADGPIWSTVVSRLTRFIECTAEPSHPRRLETSRAMPTTPADAPRIVIVGGGIGGLATAAFLR